jgi:hypothetical protein
MACKEAQESSHPPRTLNAKALSSIILARSSWDMFAHEFIVWRELSPKLRRLDLERKLIGLYQELRQGEPNPHAEEPWISLICLNMLRNELVHHNAEKYLPGRCPALLENCLSKVGLAIDPNVPWEAAVTTQAWANWACTTVIGSIDTLEQIPDKRSRSYNSIRRILEKCTEQLSGLSTPICSSH